MGETITITIKNLPPGMDEVLASATKQINSDIGSQLAMPSKDIVIDYENINVPPSEKMHKIATILSEA